MPTANEEIISKGTVTFDMLKKLGLQDIQIRLLPAKMMYKHYLDNKKLDLSSLKL